MTLQDLKSKIWSACDVLRSQGLHITDYMEQITYLMFLKNLDEKEENDKELDKALGRKHKPLFDDEKYYWKNWAQKSGRPLVKFVKNDLFPKLTDINGRNPIVKKIFKDAVFNIEEPQALKKVIGIIDSIQFYKQPIDVKGATYEFLLSKLAEAGAAGEFFTPRHIIKAMIEIVDPKIGETICDPAMGTGGFLIGTLNHILEANGDGHEDGRNLTNEQFAFLHDETFFGYEQNRKTYRMALMNMYLHGANNPKLERINTLGDGTHTERKYDVIFANPPYGGKIDNVRDNFTISTNKTELLFLQHIIQTLKEGGRAGVILPEGVMFQSGAAQKIREILLSQCETFTVVSMPAGVFQPYTGVKTDLLFFKKGTGTQKVWFFDVKNDGFDLGSQRRPIKQDDLPMLWDKFPFKGKNDFTPPKDKDLTKAESEKSWWADIDEIKENNWSLVAKKYKKTKINSEYEIVKLGNYIEEIKEKIGKNYKNFDFALGVSNSEGVIESTKTKKNELSGSYKVIKKNEFFYNPYRINVGSLGLNEKYEEGIISPAYVAFKTKEELKPEYLYFLLKSNYGIKEIKNHAQGAVRQALRFNDLSEIEIPLLPMDVQKEIINKVNRKNSILSDAKNLISKIDEEKGDIIENFRNIDCEWVKLGDVIETIKNGTNATQNDVVKGFRVTRIETIALGKIDLDRTKYVELEKNDAKKYLLNDGDILFSHINSVDHIGKTAIYERKLGDLIHGVNLQRIIIDNKKAYSKYILIILKSKYARDYYSRICKRAINQASLNQADIKSLDIPLPDLGIQEKFIEKFDKDSLLQEDLELRLKETEKTIEKIIEDLFSK